MLHLALFYKPIDLWLVFYITMDDVTVHFSLQINSKDMRSCRHEDAVAMLTGGLSYVTLILFREKVINKRMTPLSKLQDQSGVNKKLLIKQEVGLLYLVDT
jgi:hypothetical protein